MSVSLTKTAMRVIIGGLGLAAGLMVASVSIANAEDAAAPASPPAAQQDAGDSDASADDVKQIKLTDDQVTHFIAAQTDLAAIANKIETRDLISRMPPIERHENNSI